MNRKSHLPLVVFSLLLILVAACTEQNQDKVIYVGEDDAEMLAAITKARGTLPHFWKVFDKPERGESGFSLKVKIADQQGTEYFWASDIEHRDGRVIGTINNEPNIVSTVKLGDRIPVPEADIADWLYLRDSKMIGNETLKPLLKSMPAHEVAQLKQIMAEP